MPFDPTIAAARLAELASRETLPAPPGGWPRHLPRRDAVRSPAAYLVTFAAAQQGIDLHHFEHLGHLEIPEAWLHPGHPGAEPPMWSGGALPESKYHSFRHDQILGGFHPGHRGKWSSHELCHGLVGFAWASDATPFFHILAARLAELLPVVLYYFLDEVHLQRCPRHAMSGALYRSFCPECERVASRRPDDPRSADLLEEAARFLDRDLASCARSRRTGRTIPHSWAGIDLASDAMAYVEAHGQRLCSPAFHRFADDFLVDGGGWSSSLEALEARVIEVARHITEGTPLTPLAPSRAHGYWRWALQDLAWRLLTIWTETDGEARAELDRLLAILSGAVGETRHAEQADIHSVAEVAIVEAVSGYRALHDDIFVPSPETVFAVGYPLPVPELGSCTSMLRTGIESALPLTAGILEDRLTSVTEAFARQDRATRQPIGVRFAEWFAASHAGDLAELARYESTLSALTPVLSEAHVCDRAATGFLARLAEGTRIELFETDVQSLVDRAIDGTLSLLDDETLQVADPAPEAPCALAFVPDATGSVSIVRLEQAIAEALCRLDGTGHELRLDPKLVNQLLEARIVVPLAFRERY